MTTKNEIALWLKRAEPEHTHMIVVCDTFDYEDYPVFVSNKVKDAIDNLNSSENMTKVMEVYNLSLPLNDQLNKERVFNC